MKRNLHKIVAFLLVTLMGLSAFTASAADIPKGMTFYLKPSSEWKQSNARFAVYFFDNAAGKNTWVDMTKVSNDLYKVTSPNKSTDPQYKNLIFCRMDPSKTQNNWNNKWNQTADLEYDGCRELYVVTGWDGGYWSGYNKNFVAGNGTSGKSWCNGLSWDAGACSNLLVDGEITYNGVVAGTYEFKVTDGSWDTTYGSGAINYEGSTKNDCRFKDLGGKDGNVQFTLIETADITIGFASNQITVTATFAAPIEERYVLMGVGNDWANGIVLADNPNNANELILLGQPISKANDAIKIVKKSPCGDDFFANVKIVSPVPYGFDNDGNVVLEDGTYDFYFDKTTNEIYIGGTLNNANVVYLDPKVEDGNDWEVDEARFAVYYFTSNDDYGWVSADKCGGLYYASVPVAYTKYDWVRIKKDGSNTWDDKWDQTYSITYDKNKPLTKLTKPSAEANHYDSYQTTYTGICGKNYENLDCTFPAVGDTVYVHINQFVENDLCNYVFDSFEQAFAVLKTRTEICSAKTVYYGSLKEDEITLNVPVVMLVHFGPEYYKGTEKVGMSGGHINDAPAIFFRNINPNGGESLVVRTADAKGNRAVLVHPVIRRSRNIVLDNLDIISDKDLRDNALDIDTGEGDNNLEGLDKDFNIVPLSEVDHNIKLINCYVESYGRNGIHVVGIKGIHIENNEFYTKYDFSVDETEGEDVVDWGGTIKFINTTDVKFLRNNSEGTLATSFFIQGCQRVLLMNNVFWNDNAVSVKQLAEQGRTVANVRLVNFGTQAANRPVKNIGIYYNTFFIKNNDAADDSYNRFDFFRLGGKMQPVDDANKENFDPNTIRFQYNNCYSYDDDIEGNNDVSANKTTFYLQGIGIDTNWCQCFKYNNFWSQYDETNDKSSSSFEIGKFCTGDDETYNLYLNVANQVCKTNPTNPSALVVVTDSLNIGTVISEAEDVSLQGASTFFNDRYNPDNGENAIRPKMAVDNSNEALSPYDKIYNEPGTINLYTSPIVGSQTTDVMLTSIKLSPNKEISLSIVDELDDPYPSEPVRFSITNAQGTPIESVTTDSEGGLDNEPIYVTFVRPTDVASDIEYVTYEAFLKIVPTQTEDAHLVLHIPLRGHYKTKLEKIGGAWTLGAYQQRAAQPLDTIVWHGSSSTYWDDRSNWYRPDGKLVTCLDALTKT